jgi:RNA polymerase sigma-70 factor (ECF subfamily)
VLRAGVPDSRIEWDDDQREIIAALRTLPRAQREAIVLHHLVGLTVDEAADYLNAPAGTVKSWLFRGRQHLAATLASSSEPTAEEISR